MTGDIGAGGYIGPNLYEDSEMNKTEVHIAVDIETLDIRPAAVVVSVGLAAFTVQGGFVGTYFSVLDINVQQYDGRTSSVGTMEWWAKQSEAVKQQYVDAMSPVAPHPRAVMDAIRAFVNRFETSGTTVAGVYGYGSDFDNATLIDLNAQLHGEPLWQYKKNRCGRTIMAMFPDCKAKGTSNQHNALEDAVWLAVSLRQALLQFEVVKEKAAW